MRKQAELFSGTDSVVEVSVSPEMPYLLIEESFAHCFVWSRDRERRVRGRNFGHREREEIKYVAS